MLRLTWLTLSHFNYLYSENFPNFNEITLLWSNKLYIIKYLIVKFKILSTPLPEIPGHLHSDLNSGISATSTDQSFLGTEPRCAPGCLLWSGHWDQHRLHTPPCSGLPKLTTAAWLTEGSQAHSSGCQKPGYSLCKTLRNSWKNT